MHQRWHDLLFAHWRVPVEMLRPLVPRPLPVDTFDAAAWVGVIPFRMTNLRPRLIPALPWLSAFPELNVRTYVTVDGKPGVYFFSLDAGNPVAVAAARALFDLPYYRADMRVMQDGDGVRYRSTRTHRGAPAAHFVARYRPTGAPFEPTPGSLDHFLTERYCLYTVSFRGHVFRVEIDHRPWPLQPAEATLEVNTMASAQGIALPNDPPLLHFARRQDVVVWMPERVASG
jgi:uncharacterized protein YqjF (DUF2071 family)